MGKAMIFVVDSDEAVGQCDDEDRRKLEALAAKDHETAERQLEGKHIQCSKSIRTKKGPNLAHVFSGNT